MQPPPETGLARLLIHMSAGCCVVSSRPDRQLKLVFRCVTFPAVIGFAIPKWMDKLAARTTHLDLKPGVTIEDFWY